MSEVSDMRENIFCPLEKCRWYLEAKPGGRKCWYGEPQCWKGWLDLIILTFRIRFGRRNKQQ